MKNFRSLMLLLSIQSILTGAVAVNAQDAFDGKFQLSSEVRWGLAVLPAGEYNFSLESTRHPFKILIYRADRNVSAMVESSVSEDARPGGSFLSISEYGSKRAVRSLNLPQLKMSLIFEPLTRRERETLFASKSHTVPVQLAKK